MRIERRSGFTLIELLVVIAIIAVLIGLLLPAIQKVRAAAARMSCSNNLKQLGIALHSYHDENEGLPPGCATDQPPFGAGGGGWGSSWMVYLLPHIEQGNLFQQWAFNGNSGYTNSTNKVLIRNQTIKTYRCPSTSLPSFTRDDINGGSAARMFTSYVGVAGATSEPGTVSVSCCSGGSGLNAFGGTFYHGSNTKLTNFSDGTSNTIVLGEQSDHLRDNNNSPITGSYRAITSSGPHGWAMGTSTNSTPSGERCFNCVTVRWEINRRGLGNSNANGTNENTGANIPFSSTHSGGAMMLFGDGGVRFMRENTPLSLLQALATRNGGEAVTLP